jgi:hypothetical protein
MSTTQPGTHQIRTGGSRDRAGAPMRLPSGVPFWLGREQA